LNLLSPEQFRFSWQNTSYINLDVRINGSEQSSGYLIAHCKLDSEVLHLFSMISIAMQISSNLWYSGSYNFRILNFDFLWIST